VILVVNADDSRFMTEGFLMVEFDEGSENDQITRAIAMGGGPIDTNNTAARGSRERVGHQASALVDIPDMDGFVGENPGEFQKLGINGYAALVIKVCLSDHSTMDLAVEHRTTHFETPVAVPAAIMVGPTGAT